MDTLYHGSSNLFDKFDLAHALEGAGKVKFGYGVYVTSAYESAAHYSAVEGAQHHYVYSVEVPELKDGNYIAFKQMVHPSIVEAVSRKLGMEIPAKFTGDGKEFRKFLAAHFDKKDALAGERAASELLHSVGVKAIIWPYNWTKGYAGVTNRAILSDKDLRITAVDEVELDEKKHFKGILNNIKK